MNCRRRRAIYVVFTSRLFSPVDQILDKNEEVERRVREPTTTNNTKGNGDAQQCRQPRADLPARGRTPARWHGRVEQLLEYIQFLVRVWREAVAHDEVKSVFVVNIYFC